MTTQNVLGAAVIGCVVLAGWTIYNNIFAASVYPTVGSSGYDEPVVKRAPKVALREAGEAIRETFALLPDRLQVAAPISREMFNERFAAAATQGVDSNAASAAPATKVAEAKEAGEADRRRQGRGSPEEPGQGRREDRGRREVQACRRTGAACLGRSGRDRAGA